MRRPAPLLRLLLAIMAATIGASSAAIVSISNADPRLDTAGNIMDCHDGNILLIEGVYWNFCMAYGSCHNSGCASDDCGGRLDHNISIFTSENIFFRHFL